MGLDKDDTIVKRRMAQKVQFLAEDVAAAHEPSTKELKAWFAGNAEKFALPGRVTLPPRLLRLRQARAERPEGRRCRAAQARRPAAEFPARRGDGGCLHVRGLLRRPHAAAARQGVRPDLRARDIRPQARRVAGPDRIRLRLAPGVRRLDHPGPHPGLRGGRAGRAHRVAGRAEAAGLAARPTRACAARYTVLLPAPPSRRERSAARTAAQRAGCRRRPRPSDRRQRRRLGPGCALWLLLAALLRQCRSGARGAPLLPRDHRERTGTVRSSCGAPRCSPACACRSRCAAARGQEPQGPRGAGTERLAARASLDFRRSAGPGGRSASSSRACRQPSPTCWCA